MVGPNMKHFNEIFFLCVLYCRHGTLKNRTLMVGNPVFNMAITKLAKMIKSPGRDKITQLLLVNRIGIFNVVFC